MIESLRRQLTALAGRDREVRARLAADGSLFDGYHPEMQAVHDANAAALQAILEEHGWPTAALAGNEGAHGAWLIAQHAIALPDFQRACLVALESAASSGRAPQWQPAMLLDRILVLEGKPQLYGTQFDWDEAGEMSPLPIEHADTVDRRRADLGLPPLADAIADHRTRIGSEKPPADRAKRIREMEDWAKRTGWR